MSLVVAGAAFGEVQVSVFVAGAALGEILIDSRGAKCSIFNTKCPWWKGRFSCEASCRLTASFWDHAQIMVESAPHCK